MRILKTVLFSLVLVLPIVITPAQAGSASSLFDIDGDGETKALTDGLLLLRYLFGFTGTTLTDDAVENGAPRNTPAQIIDYIENPTGTALTANSIASAGGSIFLSGSIDDTDRQWDRPSRSCESGSGLADHYFEAHRIINNTGAAQTLRITANWDNGDGFLHLFKNGIDTINNPQLVDCIIGDDDFGGISRSQIDEDSGLTTIEPGKSLIILASTLTPNLAIGSYTIEVLTLNSIAPVGSKIFLSGSIDDTDRRWDRLAANCTSDNGPADHYFESHIIINNTGAARTLRITANWDNGDGFLHLVIDTRLNPQPGDCIIGDDDFGGSGGSQISEDSGLTTIEPGESLNIVASTFKPNIAIGSYTIEVLTTP